MPTRTWRGRQTQRTTLLQITELLPAGLHTLANRTHLFLQVSHR